MFVDLARRLDLQPADPVPDLDAARASGKRLGRPTAMTPEQIRHARDLLTRPDNPVASIARLLGVSRSTLYKHVPELSSGRRTTTSIPTSEETPMTIIPRATPTPPPHWSRRISGATRCSTAP
ncbi:helix-turn-helix domain-containing protein [Nocardiopsis sp. LOL_012]|uniref:helix-turn-helix domain-containing protein n=1 Tax=Nocardiopsis sp. LOL_012 TaxID=3345409 RepID=UPI003A84910C